jgi:hypothetical protein
VLVSLKHAFAVFCTPKCASNSIEALLRPYCEIQLRGSPPVRHTNVRAWDAYVRPYLTEACSVGPLETIGVVREPVSWLASWYRFRARHELRSRRDPNSTADISFLEFVEAYTSATPPPYADVGSQFDFVRTERGDVGIDVLFRYDDLGRLVDYFSEKVGRRLRLKALNVSPRAARSIDFLERADAVRRRVVGRFGRGGVSAEPNLPDVPSALTERLRETIPKDFEIYERLARKP